MEVIAKNLEETYATAEDFVQSIIKNTQKRTQAIVIALYGELGSGKTSFVQGAAKALGIKETIISPTFVILKKYQGQTLDSFIHIDLYRIEREEELAYLGWEDIVHDPRNIIFVEWAEKIEALLPDDTIKIYFEHINEQTRKITVKNIYGAK